MEQDAVTSEAASAKPQEARGGDDLDMPLVDALRTQRAIRRLRPDPVDDDVLLRAIELALKAPTGSNAQNWEFVVVRDREKVAGFARLYRAAWRLYSPIANRKSAANEAEARLYKAVRHQIDNFEEIPVLVVPCLRVGVLGRFPLQPTLLLSSTYGSAYPSVQNFLLVCRATGLGATLTTLPLWNVRRARRILGLPLGVLPVCVIPVGWPQGRYGPTRRRPVEDVVHVDSYGNRPFRQA